MYRLAACLCASLALVASPASAEVGVPEIPPELQLEIEALGLNNVPGFTPSADLALMMSKGGNSAEARQILQMVLQVRRPGRDLEVLRQQVFRRMGDERGADLSKPFNYAVAAQVQQARQRAQIWSQMLVADLNNDGQITKQELKDTLEIMPSDGISDAFFTSDANEDNVLSAEELREAVESRSQTRRHGGAGQEGVARMFDFDDDGFLTAAEFQRGALALGYAAK